MVPPALLSTPGGMRPRRARLSEACLSDRLGSKFPEMQGILFLSVGYATEIKLR